MDLATPSSESGRWSPLRIAATTLLVATLMYAVIGHFARTLDATRVEQIRVGEVDRKITAALDSLDRARLGEKDIPSRETWAAAEDDMQELVRIEGRASTIGLSEAFDQCLAGIDTVTKHLKRGDKDEAMMAAYATRPPHERLQKELASLDRRCQRRAETAVWAIGASVLGTLLVGAALVGFFASRHARRSVTLVSLEMQNGLSDARERRFRLLLQIEEATQDLLDPVGVATATSGLLGAFLGAAPCAFDAPNALGGDVLTALRLGRPRVEETRLHCPLLRDGRLHAVLSVQGETGRVWRHDEIALVEEVAARYGAYLERTEADAAKRQSRWSSALLDAQVNSSLDGIIIVDCEGKPILQNRRMAEVWGVSDEIAEDAGDARNIGSVAVWVKHPEEFLAGIEALYANPQRTQRDEIELINGTVLDRHTAPALGLDGTIYGRIWTFRDITHRIRIENELREAQEELEARVESRTRDLAAATLLAERANAAKSEFLSRMSHELRTPLNAILGFGGILGKQKLDALQRESVDYILKGGRHLLGLINEVLDISRVETGNAELSIEPVPLDEVLDESFAMVRTMAFERGVRLEEGSDQAGEIHLVADRQRLKQVLINLLSNAVKYNRPDGSVTARLSITGGRLRLAIEDTGVGISPEGIERLFVPFERLDAAASGVEGTGLGLFLTQKLVTTMGGTLTLESEVGRGSVFTVDLAIAASPSETLTLVEGGLTECGPTPVDEDRTFSILMIDDNSANVRLLERVLAGLPNVALTAAHSGLAGLEATRKGAPDLVLLDLTLPDMSGTEVLTRLKRSATTRGIPVVVVSADACPERRAENLRLGAADFLTKPLDVDRFLAVVGDALRPRKEAA